MDAPNQTAPAPAPPDRRAGQFALAAFGVILAGLLAFRGYADHLAARPTEPVSPAAVLDLNRASAADLERLPGVGPKVAAAIDAHRRARGPFAAVEELRAVPGVGPVTVDRLRPYVRVEPATPTVPVLAVEPEIPIRARAQAPAESAPAEKGAAPRGSGVRKLQPGDPPIDVNTAPAEELLKLPGVGPVIAGAIVAGRPYRRVEDLDRVRGIGPKTLEKLRPFVVVGG